MCPLKWPDLSLAFVLCVLLWGRDCSGFNLDTTMPISRTGPADSLFGYTVALHRQSDGENVLLVGAPQAQTAQPDVERGGAVYRCPVLADDCDQVIFDPLGQPVNGDGEQVGSKSDQFFGATLHSSGPGGPVVACAPRRIWSFINYNASGSLRYLTGSCFVAFNDFLDNQEVAPCEKPGEDPSNLGVHSNSYCQAGFSAEVSQDGQLLLGAPGSFYWQGQIFSIDLNNPTASTIGAERLPEFDNFYQGYTVARGRFGANGVYVVSEPRAAYFLGYISVLDDGLNKVDSIPGEQMSAYFGHALVVTDVNADGLDDLIIGAPMFVDPDNLIDRWEVGRVYVYCQEAGGNLKKTDVMTGSHQGGQFGFSIGAIGDINRDGFNDAVFSMMTAFQREIVHRKIGINISFINNIAVGAPFAGEDSSGIVYIYQGRRNGIRQAASQELRPADFGLNIQSFGSSLSGGLDMDGNNFNDVLVGAYMSSVAVLVRSRPIVRIQKSLTFEPEQINLDIKDYQLLSGEKVSSFNVTTCLTARGLDIPASLNVKYSVQLDATLPTSSRAAFIVGNNLDLSEMTRTVTLISDQQMCQKDLVYVKIVIIEKILPISVRLSYELAPEETPVSTVTSAISDVPPILNDTPLPFLVESLLIKNTCKNYLCVPDLLLKASTNTERVAVGDNWELGLQVAVTNNGEDAYDATLRATIPEGMIFVRVERTSSDLTVTCSSDEESDVRVVTCDIGNPLPEEYTVKFGMTIANDQLTGDNEELVINMEVNSLNYEPRNITKDNYANVTVGVYATAEVGLYGVSAPQQVLYMRPNGSVIKPDPETEQDAGAEVTHLYMLRNLGPSEVGRTIVKIYWPLLDTDGDYLLYLISAKLATGEDCQVEGGVNPDNLELEQDKDATNSSDLSGLLSSDLKSRKRRQSDDRAEEALPQDVTGVTIECSKASDWCVLVTCNVNAPSGVGEDEDSALIRIRSRLYEKTLMEKDYKDFYVSSTANAAVQTMPYMASILPDAFPTATAEAITQVIGQKPETPGRPPTQVIIIPIWVYIIAALCGVILMLLFILGLWKCGFFKRKKIAPNDPQAAAKENWQKDVLIDDLK